MQRMKLLSKVGLSFIIFLSLIFQSIGGVSAKNVTLDRNTSMSSYLTVKAHTDNLGAYHDKQGKRVFKIDGQYAYCIESDVGLSDDHIYQDGQDAQDILSSKPNKLTTWRQKYDMLSVLLSMLPTTILHNSKDEHIQWLVGQTMIWEVTGEERGERFSYIGNTRAGSMAYRDTYQWSESADQKAFQKYYQEFETKIQDYWMIPSFMSRVENTQKIILDQWNGSSYYTTLTDTNNVLDHYDFVGHNLSIEKNGQQLKVMSSSVSSNQLVATLKTSYHLKAPIFWSDGHFQRTMTSGNLNEAKWKAYAQVEVAKGNLEVIKNDSFQQPIKGAVFQITAPSGDISTHTTDNQGKITLNNVECGVYLIQEKSAPDGYLIKDTIFSLSVYPQKTASQTIVNEEPMGSIDLIKTIETSQTNGKQGDAYLQDNEYSLYAKKRITNQSGNKVYFEKDQLVGKALTDAQGKLSFTQLHLGDYYIKETKSNSSLILNSKMIDVSLTYQNMHTSLVTQSLKTSNTVNSQRIQIFKQGEGTGSAGVVKGLQGAEFTFVLNSEFEKVGFEKAEKSFIGTTDEQGLLTTSLLPYGVYRVKETKTPQGYYGASDFLVTIDKDTHEYEIGYQIKQVTVNNLPFASLLKIIKIDQTTGKTIQRSGATFKIKNLDTKEYVSYTDWSQFPQIIVNQWTTHKDGSITLNTKLKAGHYQLEEIKAPEGYQLNTQPLLFEISQDHYEISSDQVTPITIVKFKDQSILGQVTIEKSGEVLVDYRNHQFIYEDRGMAGAEFGIYAKEDILDPSYDGTVLYKKGELIEKLVTRELGKVTSSKLPLGEYECRELKAPKGYVLNHEVKSFEFSTKKQDTNIVYEKIHFTNQRQKVVIDVSKKDEDTLHYVAGAEISLIANRDIYNDAGQIIVKAGTVLETVTSTNNGKVKFHLDLPLDLIPEFATLPSLESSDVKLIGNSNSLYMLQETKQPNGYLSKKVNNYIDAIYTNQNEENIHFEYDFLNRQTQTIINKVDANTNLAISGAHLQIIDPLTHQVIDEWISDSQEHVTKGLTVDKVYILHELQAPEGYMIGGDQEFMIRDSEERQSVTFVNALEPVIVLGDEPEIVKTGDQTIFLSYILMGVGAVAIMLVLFKKKD